MSRRRHRKRNKAIMANAAAVNPEEGIVSAEPITSAISEEDLPEEDETEEIVPEEEKQEGEKMSHFDEIIDAINESDNLAEETEERVSPDQDVPVTMHSVKIRDITDQETALEKNLHFATEDEQVSAEEEAADHEAEQEDEEESPMPNFFANRNAAMQMLNQATEKAVKDAEDFMEEAGIEPIVIDRSADSELKLEEPAEEPEEEKEIVRAKWIHDRREDPAYVKGFAYLRTCTCSVCGYKAAHEFPKCPQCHAEMVASE